MSGELHDCLRAIPDQSRVVLFIRGVDGLTTRLDDGWHDFLHWYTTRLDLEMVFQYSVPCDVNRRPGMTLRPERGMHHTFNVEGLRVLEAITSPPDGRLSEERLLLAVWRELGWRKTTCAGGYNMRRNKLPTEV